jgi:hypothetical protein
MRPMSRTKFHALVSTCLAALLVSACVVTPPPDQPAQPAAAAHPDESSSPGPAVAQAEPEPGYQSASSAEPPAEPARSTPPPPPPREQRQSAVDAPAYPPDPPPAPHGASPARPPTQRPHQLPPGERPNEYVPSRRARLGPVAEFSIEPTAGPVGTTITIYGDFRNVRNPRQIGVSFAGTRRVVQPVYVASDRVAVIVPKNARTGDVVVNVRNRAAWRGRFSVTPSDSDIFLPTPVDSGLVGAVYRLAPNTDRLPNFSAMGKPYATIVVPSLKVSPRRFESGFPGLEDKGEPLLEWFAIRFIGRLWVPASGAYDFRVNSDDGARLYIDERLVLDNDGVHAPRSRDGVIDLAAGSHDIVVEYFQGPRFEIALELSWRHSGRGWELVPPEAFSRYTGGYECSSEPQMFCCAGNLPECRACRENARRATEEWRARCAGVVPPDPGPGPGPGPAPVDCSNEPQRFCCQAQTAACQQCRQLAASERAQWLQQCGKPGGSAPPPATPAPPAPIDCRQEPQRMCCQAATAGCQQCQREAQAERAQWLQACGKPGAPATPAPAPIDCRQEPQRMCCQGRTAECRTCRREAQRERDQWLQACGGQAPGTPGTPAPVDCSQQPQRFCCQAQTAQCQQCRQLAASERAQWVQQCGGGGPAPGRPGLDCSKEPERMCCAAATAECQQCQRDAQDERREWQRICRPGGSPAVDCSNRPSRACCKALTAECNSCQEQAKAELDRWQAACSN